ncbi:MAG: hypothetical protein Q9159_005568 [Coniocarpon cinnabarinum]
MADKRINILVYSGTQKPERSSETLLINTGTGASPSAIQHAVHSLKQHLSPNYAVHTLATEVLLNEPWGPTCALLVFPGGGDLGYCRLLNGKGNQLIRQYVENGGKYLGLCAGGYYGASRCEFETGDRGMEVVGSRELGFFPGTCRGSVFKGFEYGSDKGTRAARLRVHWDQMNGASATDVRARVYTNGGGVFIGAGKTKDVEVLAEFDEAVDVEHDEEKAAAVVYGKIGEGGFMLTGPHPEFA